jgi:class 3 adenylate cyclase
MGPSGSPGMQGQEKAAVPKGPPSPEVPTATGTGVKHPAAAVPFSREWKEWVFLVLVGAVMTAGGLFGYRIARSRARRRPGPASFMTEAVLVVDLVDSTHLATHYGDGLAMRARTVLKDRTLAATEGHGLAFAENTGDGYFMTFPSVVDAAQTAIALLQDLRKDPPDLSPGPALGVRVGISYGEILMDGKGVRHGAVINRAFRLEGLTREGLAQVDGGLQPEAIPDRDRIFLDEEAAQELRTGGIPLRFVGFFNLKGFPGLHQVHEVLWEAQG